MARLFTTPFSFQNQLYTAVVAITECQRRHTVMIYLPDDSLHQLLPEGRISFSGEEGLLVDYPQATPAQELLIAVLAAIEAYQEANPLPIKIKQL